MHSEVAAIIVHHRRLDEIFGTIDAILAAGVPAGHVIVVDTSEDEETVGLLSDRQVGWHLLVMENRGYGAAVNRAVESLAFATEYVVVMTHESRCGPDDLRIMIEAFAAAPLAAVVGPEVLFTEDGVWSRGGRLTKWLRLPRHRLEPPAGEGTVLRVDWIDGAIAIYRTALLRQFRFREEFFLYMEETELHTRLREQGFEIVTAVGASARQSTSGMPGYWGVRNTFLFQSMHGTRFSRLLAPVYVLLRTFAELAARGRWADAPSAIRGFRDGARFPADQRLAR